MEDVIKYWNIAQEALEPLTDWFVVNKPIDVMDSTAAKKISIYQSPKFNSLGILMRQDWEISATALHESELKDEELAYHIGKLMTLQLTGDFADLLENGDLSSEDSLWKAMDGAKKRGKDPILVEINYAQTFRYYAKKKDSYEYTMFALLNVEWEE